MIPTPITFSEVDHGLTDFEQLRMSLGLCIDCDARWPHDWIAGPEGGGSQNCACSKCGVEVNVSVGSLSQRQSPRHNPNKQRVAAKFGIYLS